jgi:small subunit ribosomal protein S16
MVKIRLAKLGRKKDVFFRIIAIDQDKKNIGRALANLGHWYPRNNNLEIDKKAIAEWVSKGAQLSATVKGLMEQKAK